MIYGMLQHRIPVAAIQSATVGCSSANFMSFPENGRGISIGGFINGQVHVEVAVIVIIKKAGHGTLYMNIEPIFSSHIFKMRNAVLIDPLVYIKNISPPQ